MVACDTLCALVPLCYVGWDTGLSSLKNRHSSLSFTVCEFITAKYITRRCSDFKGEMHYGIGVQNTESRLCMRNLFRTVDIPGTLTMQSYTAINIKCRFFNSNRK